MRSSNSLANGSMRRTPYDVRSSHCGMKYSARGAVCWCSGTLLMAGLRERLMGVARASGSLIGASALAPAAAGDLGGVVDDVVDEAVLLRLRRR